MTGPSRKDDVMSIGPYEFKVDGGSLEANLRPRMFYWSLRIYATGVIDGDALEAVAYSENLLPLLNKPLSKWQDAIANNISWVNAYNESSGQYEGSLYLYSHEAINRSVIRFGAPLNGTFRVSWSGTAEVNASPFDEYEDVSFACSALVEYIGVIAKGLEVDDARSKIAEFITDEQYALVRSLPDGSHVFLPKRSE